ncbi:MAG: Rossmann-like and DUF2520 domain-containing protein [Flavobacteriaceae bacterium]
MIRIVILGTGNIGSHLLAAFENVSALEVVQVYNRSFEGLNSIRFRGSKTTHLNELVDADCYIIAVPDDAVAKISDALPFENRLVVHTSGSVALSELNPKNRRGVFYPLQTFSKNRKVYFNEIPFCLEASDQKDLEILKTMARTISSSVHEIDSEKRKQLHLAAVFVCNFVNHLYQIGYEITENNQIPFSILKPLIKETASKIERDSPMDMQTGPAKRNDTSTMNKHIDLLDIPIQKDLYKLLSQAITETYGREKL